MSGRARWRVRPKDGPIVRCFLSRLSSRLQALIPLGMLVALAACGPQAPIMVGTAPSAAPLDMGRTRVALLLPLSGQQAPLGQALQQAAELALFEQNDRRVEFVPLDTGGNAMGAGDAARRMMPLAAPWPRRCGRWRRISTCQAQLLCFTINNLGLQGRWPKCPGA